MYAASPIVLYAHQKTRNTSLPREFFKNYFGTVVTMDTSPIIVWRKNMKIWKLVVAGVIQCDVLQMCNGSWEIKGQRNPCIWCTETYCSYLKIEGLLWVLARGTSKTKTIDCNTASRSFLCVGKATWNSSPAKIINWERFYLLLEPRKVSESFSWIWQYSDLQQCSWKQH